MTQQQLAGALNRPQSFIAKVEAGERRIDVVEFVYLSSAMGIDPAQFVGELAADFGPKIRSKKLNVPRD